MPPQQRREEELDEEATAALREPLLSLPSSSSADDYYASEHASSASPSSSSSSSSSSSEPSRLHRKLLSRNVPLTLTHTAFYYAGSSIWSSNVLSTYIYMLLKEQQHDNHDDPQQAVGYITGIMGIFQLLCSYPAGRYADSHRRDTLLRLASVLGILAIGTTLYALLSTTQDHYHGSNHLLMVALALWGCTLGIGNTALWALFADSIPSGDRSHYFTKRSILTTLGTVAGPVTSLIMFLFLGGSAGAGGGDHPEWQVRNCALVLAVGQCVSLPAMILFFFFNDDYAVHEYDDDDDEGLQAAADVTDVHERSLLMDPEYAQLSSPLPVVNQEFERNDHADGWWCIRCCHFIMQKRRIPSLVAMADLVGGLATGMSVRYFPIFLVNSLQLGPVAVQLIYVMTPILQASMAALAQRLSNRFGRLHVTVFHKWIGALLMYAMMAAHEIIKAPVVIVIVLFICRTATVNSVGSLTRSTLMDHVPKSERGQWSALESVNVSGWSGSAVLGGMLVGRIGLTHLFLLTASLQIIATLPLMALFRDDELEQSVSSTTTNARTSGAAASVAIQGGGGSTLQLLEGDSSAAIVMPQEVAARSFVE
jgi:predicted MFS family arabinose efflux permease